MSVDIEQRLRDDTEWLESHQRRCDLAPGFERLVVDVGHGQPVVFVPMLGELNVLYVPIMRAVVAAGLRAVCYTPLVLTRSRLHVADRVAELCAIMQGLQLEECHVIAWSDTAAVAHRLAVDHRQRVRTLAFVIAPDRYRLPSLLRALLFPLSAFPIEQLVPNSLVSWILGFYMSGPNVPARTVRSFAQRIPNLAAVFKWSCLPCIEEHLVDGALRMPQSLVVAGDRSKVVPVDQAEALRKALHSSEALVLIRDGEHLATYANSGEVNAAVLGFLRRVRSGASAQ